MTKQHESTKIHVLINDAFCEDEVCEVIKCLVCGREIKLWFNGGELGEEVCCGYRYYGKHIKIQILAQVVEEEDGG